MLVWWVATVCVTAMTGCGGCRPDPLVERKNELDDVDKRKKVQKPLDDFVMTTAQTLPPDDTAVRPLAKPGHWVTAFQEIKANNFDASAELRSAATDSRGVVFPVPRTPYELTGYQPVQLPKGQSRRFETTYFIPFEAGNLTRQVWLERQLRAARGGNALLAPDRVPIAVMPDYQYFFLVLSAAPDRYAFLKTLTSFSAPRADLADSDSMLLYRVLLPQIDRLAPVPDHSLTWTSMAYVLLDDFDPAWLTLEQEVAFLDWLHWGGQVIVSGPRSLDRLRGSFLEPYLPAVAVRTTELSEAALAELDAAWSLPPDRQTGRLRRLVPKPNEPLVGVELLPHDEAQAVPDSGRLVFERTVGRGRTVVTAFSLTDPTLLQWGPSYDGFLNGCLLRRPARRFRVTEFLPQADFADGRLGVDFSEPRLATRLRYWSRDTQPLLPSRRVAATSPQAKASSSGGDSDVEVALTVAEEWGVTESRGVGVGGVGAWNDESGVSSAARTALEDAAGITIPQGGFVLRVLAVYLFVLAPLNWAFFRLLGRVEWAWVAAPVIAVIGALAVVRLAQLDIGFARSTTEVAVVELQAGYPRGHASRFLALYTSLSTGYAVDFEVPRSSVAQPLSMRAQRRSSTDQSQEVAMHQEASLRVDGFQVASNSIGYLHAEQFLDVGGAFRIEPPEMSGENESQRWVVKNDSTFSLNDVGVVYRQADGSLQTAWLGGLAAGISTPLTFRPQTPHPMTVPEWGQSLLTSSYEAQADELLKQHDANQDGVLSRAEAAGHSAVAAAFDRLDWATEGQRGVWGSNELREWCRESRAGELSLGELFALAATRPALGRGEMRLIGWTDQVLPQLGLQPQSSQATRRTLVLVQLRSGHFPRPVRDENCLADVVTNLAPAPDNAAPDNAASDNAASDNAASDNAAPAETDTPPAPTVSPPGETSQARPGQ